MRVAKGAEATVRQVRSEDGKDIWLFGGDVLFQRLLQAGLVETVEISVMPLFLVVGCHRWDWRRPGWEPDHSVVKLLCRSWCQPTAGSFDSQS